MLKPLRALLKPLRAALVVWVSVGGLGLVVHLATAVLYLAFFSRKFDALIRAANLGVSVFSLLNIVVWTVVFILFLMWIYRASRNLRFATDQPLVNSPGSAVFWFFVPVANFFMPRRVMKEIWYASHLGRPDGHATVNRLWTLWIILIVYSIPISIFMANASAAGTRGMALLTYTVLSALEVARGLAILSFVTSCTAAYEANVDEMITEPVDRNVNASDGWYADPMGRHELRFWNGREWTEWVSDGGVQVQDPVQ